MWCSVLVGGTVAKLGASIFVSIVLACKKYLIILISLKYCQIFISIVSLSA